MSELGRPMIALEDVEYVAQGVDHPEGICLTPDGTIYIGGEQGQIYRIDEDGTYEEILSTGGFMLGLASDASGILYGCDIGLKTIWRIDPMARTYEPFCDTLDGAALTSPNWGCFASDGRFFFSDSGDWRQANGRIGLIPPGGCATAWTLESKDFPNGIALSPDQRYLYVLESTPGALVRFEILDDGRAGPREPVADLAGTVPDGLAFAEDGSIVIACYRPDAILRWDPSTGLAVLAADPEGTAIAAPTNVVFAGADRRTILVPNINRWHVSRFRHPDLVGVPLFYPAL